MSNKIPIKGNIRIKKEDKGYVVFNLDTSGFHSLTEDSIAILNACDGKNSAEDIVNKFSKERSLEKKEFKKNLESFLDELLKRKIIKWQD